jgi:hypothetical protein
MQRALPWFTATVVLALAAVLLRNHANGTYVAGGAAIACLVYGLIQLTRRSS